MIRTLIKLTGKQASKLPSMAAAPSREATIARAVSAAGRFSSKSSDTSANHDRYLAEAFEGR